jgi:hypothetical protein
MLGERSAWDELLRERLREWSSLEAERAKLAQRSVAFPEGFGDNDDAQAAVVRAAKGERLWPIISVNKGPAKALVAGIQLDGTSVRTDDSEGWKFVAAVMQHVGRRHEATARWAAFAGETGAPTAPGTVNGADRAAASSCGASSIAFPRG